MSNRDLDLKKIRPAIKTLTINENMSGDEYFQNAVLRPVIKLQNDLFIEVFRNYIAKHKYVFYDLSLDKRTTYIENAIQKDMKFRNSLKGMVIGQFTTDEYLLYIKNSSALNKRMMNIVKERLLSNIQLFVKPEYLTAV
ncbi:glyoxalase [Tamlana sp. 62-3]|uniref:Glyoxalase n=2 Tax=Neotamlana TaxID=3400367 RepID=A0A9X1L4S9_9FLAO|nr:MULTISPECIES: glyoxalase [Tamlana]MCB4797683.1 glyoxalase [Tamlana laminarinivorans]MCB4808507.1 glyoxalase [Tamlana sargassicola]